MNFKDFKKNKNNLKNAIKKVSEEEENKSNRLETYFPKADKEGNSYSIVRFLPQPNSDKLAYEIIRKHKDKLPDGKYISMLCPTSFGKTCSECPICSVAHAEYSRQKADGVERPTGIKETRATTRVINVLVVEDEAQPDTVGRVMPMFIGRDIFQKIERKLFPKKRGDVQPEAEVIYDLWEGRNFILDLSKGSNGYTDYSECHWDAETSPVATTDKKIEAIFNQLIDLGKQFNNPEKLLTNEQMVEKWDAFHSGTKTKSLGEKQKQQEKLAEEKAKQAHEEEKKKEEHQESFSTNDTSLDEEEVPW